DPHIRVRRRIGAVVDAKQPVVAAHERFGRRVDELDATHLRRCFRTLADRHDRDRAVGSDHERRVRRHADRSALAHHCLSRAVLQQSSWLDAQVAGPRISLATVRALHRDPARTVEADVEIASRVRQSALRRIPTNRGVRRVGARRKTGTRDRATLERAEIGAKTGRARVGEVVVVDGLRAKGFLRASHRDVEEAIHEEAYLMLMIVCVIASAVEIICAFAWKLRCAVIMFTSCSVMSTFDASSAPDCTSPKPELPAWPRSAWPEP